MEEIACAGRRGSAHSAQPDGRLFRRFRKEGMLLASVLHYLVQSNVPRSVSYYDSNFGSLSDTVRLSGYSHKELEQLFSNVCREAQSRSTPVEVIHHCLDASIQGVILPEYSTGAFGVDILDSQDPDRLKEFSSEAAAYRQHTERAREILIRARSFHDEEEAIYIRHMDFSAADRLTRETIHNLLAEKQGSGQGREIHRFFGAASILGNICYIPELTESLPRRYFIKGRPGTGKSTFLKKIAKAAHERGFETEIYHCSLEPNSLDMIVVRELGFCVFDSTAPHEYFPSRPGDEIIDVYESCVTPGTDEKYQQELSRLEAQYKALVKEATSRLKEASEDAARFYTKLPPLEDTAQENLTESVLKRLFR